MELERAGGQRVDGDRGVKRMSLDMFAAPQLPRILIIEDEAILALLLEEFLTDAGFEVAGVAGRLETALGLIKRGVFDAAIVDANLAGVSSGPAALALSAVGIPFVVVSGYLPEQQPRAFSGALCLQKPCRPDDLIQALRGLLPVQSAIASS
jgi:DNA-binding response OmpR family regulator